MRIGLVVALMSMMCAGVVAQGEVLRVSDKPPGLDSVMSGDEAVKKLVGRRYALLIPVNYYEQTQYFRELRYPEKDVGDFVKLLKKSGWDTTVMSASGRPELHPTSAAGVLDKIKQLAELVREEDTLLVFLGGHGVNARAVDYEESAAKSALRRDWFCLRSTRLEKSDVGLRVRGAVALEEVRRIIESSRARKTLLVSDICRSPAGTRSAGKGITLQRLSQSVMNSALFSTSPGATAEEPREGQLDVDGVTMSNSLFMHYFLKGLRGPGNETGDGFITFREMSRYVHRELKRHAIKGGTSQVPWVSKSSDVESDIFLVWATERIPTPRIIVDIPRNGARLSPGPVTFSGSLKDAGATPRVRVAGRDAKVTAGRWKATLFFLQASEYSVPIELLVPGIAAPVRTIVKISVDAVDDVKPEELVAAEVVDGVEATPTVGALDWATPKKGTAVDPKTGLPKRVVDKETGMELVLIPAGNYRRGAPLTEAGALNTEQPVHSVTISKPFYMGIYEVTQAEWVKVMGENPSTNKNERQPVETVSWQKVQAFCKSSKAGFRLPTSAEWEYACRAGTTTPFSFGSTLSADDVNFNANVPYLPQDELGVYWGKPREVGKYEPNNFGLYDMHGNVFEWCQDRWNATAYRRYRRGATDPLETESAVPDVIIKGGAFESRPDECRSALFYNRHPQHADYLTGFRVVRTP